MVGEGVCTLQAIRLALGCARSKKQDLLSFTLGTHNFREKTSPFTIPFFLIAPHNSPLGPPPWSLRRFLFNKIR
jgi:hypothetical protein